MTTRQRLPRTSIDALVDQLVPARLARRGKRGAASRKARILRTP